VIAASLIGIVTALVTTRPSQGLWIALGVLVIVGAALQAAVTYSARDKSKRVQASGVASVAIGGSARREIRTRVHGNHVSPVELDARDGVAASGPGAVAVGGDAAGPISTELVDDESPPA
jgi:hypothetical protein